MQAAQLYVRRNCRTDFPARQRASRRARSASVPV